MFVVFLSQKVYLLEVLVNRFNWHEDHKKQTRKMLHNHESYRTMVAPYDGDPPATTACMTSWPMSLQRFFTLGEASVYGKVYDSSFRAAIKNRRIAEELLEYQAIKEEYDEIVKIYDEEEQSKKAAEDAARELLKQSMKEEGDADKTELVDDGEVSKPMAQVSPAKNVGNFAVGTSEYFDALANRHARSITLMAEPNGESAVRDAIQGNVTIKDIHGIQGRSYFLVALERVHCGESVTAPKLRPPPLPVARVKKMLNGCMSARGDCDYMPAPGDMYALLDGGSSGLTFYLMGFGITCALHGQLLWNA